MNPIQQFLKSFDWHYVANNFFGPFILQGLSITIILAVFAQLVGTLIGLLLYFMRRSRWLPVRWFADLYILFYRGTPLLVQILFLFLALPYLGLARPLRSFDIFTQLGYSNVFFDSFIAGFLALALNEGAYMAEIVRAGIDSIDPGQMEAARSLGMTYTQGMRRIVIPQAMRVIIPPLGNEFNNMLKTTSLVSVISLNDLLGASEAIGQPAFRTLELLVVAAIWYLILSIVWGFIQAYLERRFSPATANTSARDVRWWERVFGIGRQTVPVPAGATAAGVTPSVPVDSH